MIRNIKKINDKTYNLEKIKKSNKIDIVFLLNLLLNFYFNEIS